MSGLYLTWLVDVLRGAGCSVRENSLTDGWQTRARSSGGFPSTPLGVQWHHTASNAAPDGDLSWMIRGSDDAPIGNVLLDREGTFWPIAAGASNTAGKGGPLDMSRGTIPLDSGNTRSVAIEAANGGTGEPWGAAQIDAYFRGSNAINAKLGNLPTDVFNHQTWAPTRKVDPATAAAVHGTWRPRSCTSSGTWDQGDVRAECSRRAGSTPTPPPDQEDDDVKAAVYQASDDARGPWLWWDGQRMGWVRDSAQLSVGRVMGVYSNPEGVPMTNFSKAQLQTIASSSWADSGPHPDDY